MTGGTGADPSVDAVICQDGVITGLGRYDAFSEEVEKAETQDLNNAHIFPGFIDTYSAPAIDAFDQAVAKDPEFREQDVLYWISEAMDYLNDKGVCMLCLHGPGNQPSSAFRNTVGTEDTSILYDVTYETEYEKDDYEGRFDDILDNPKLNLLLFHPLYDDCETTDEALSLLTLLAAENIGMEDALGTIEVGKRANFTVFDESPLGQDLKTFSRMHADMIINEGNVVYNAYDQAIEELYDLMSHQMF